MYYLRTRPAVDAVQFTVDKMALRGTIAKDESVEIDVLKDKENISANSELRLPSKRKYNEQLEESDGCLMCSG